jgi:hypothetical protein
MKPTFSIDNINNATLSRMPYTNNAAITEVNNLGLSLCNIAVHNSATILQTSSVIDEEK